MNSSSGSSYTYNYIIHVFAINYDILRIMGGIVATMTSNQKLVKEKKIKHDAFEDERKLYIELPST